MATVNTLVLTGFGINCDYETQTAFQRPGATAVRVHLNALLDEPGMLDDTHILAVPGGFSFGDDVASGRIFANRLRYRLGPALEEFVDDGKLVIGICNGFQVLVKLGLLPRIGGVTQQTVTLTHNDSSRYEDRWVTLAINPGSPCIWTQGITQLEVPVRHGEGKFIVRDADTLEALNTAGQLVARYAAPAGAPANGAYPHNPNGSENDIAAICDPTGRIFGLMPHPEAYLDATNHPLWTRTNTTGEGAGMAVFRNAVRYAGESIGHENRAT